MPSKIKGCKILRFVQYKNFIFVSIDGDRLYLSAINIKDGTWEKIIEGPETMALFYRIFIYDNKFICEYDGKVIIYGLTGEKEEYFLENNTENAEVSIQCIVDEKIYYFYRTENEKKDASERKVKCCDLNGENKRVFFQYNSPDAEYDNLRFEDQCIYLLADYTLFRIPLYGGKIEKAFNRETYFYDISDMYIFFLDESNGNVYKTKTDLSSEIILVKEPGPCNMDIPFICVGSHIMLKECDENQEDLISDIAENELPGIDIEYVNDYRWITEEGTIEETVEGTHLSAKQYKEYKREIDKLK